MNANAWVFCNLLQENCNISKKFKVSLEISNASFFIKI